MIINFLKHQFLIFPSNFRLFCLSFSISLIEICWKMKLEAAEFCIFRQGVPRMLAVVYCCCNRKSKSTCSSSVNVFSIANSLRNDSNYVIKHPIGSWKWLEYKKKKKSWPCPRYSLTSSGWKRIRTDGHLRCGRWNQLKKLQHSSSSSSSFSVSFIRDGPQGHNKFNNKSNI